MNAVSGLVLAAVLTLGLASPNVPTDEFMSRAYLPFINRACVPNILEGHLCVLRVDANPVPRGATAFAYWHIPSITFGEFDRGDGQGFRGPIAQAMRVDVPNVTSPRMLRLRWRDNNGVQFEDSLTLIVRD